jgi:tetratricopeptide (TPR) repeat protein
MIVRNESAILERCLRSVLPHIGCYVICDTGSTDNTVEIARRVLSPLPGEVHSIVFQNFQQARNEALELARASKIPFDYLLLIDADMELSVIDPGFRDQLTHAGYLVRQVGGSLSYYNLRLLARDAPARYIGLTHEYLDPGAPTERLEGIVMLDHACGSSRSEKTERDLALLETALLADPHDTRSLFYLAQTLREAGRQAEAIAAYQRRIDLGGWEEEAWYSRFMIAYCHQAAGNTAEFVAGCLEAYQMRPSRAEPLHTLARHYRLAGHYEASALFCEAGLRIPFPDDLLFVDEEVYRSGSRHELSISGFYCASSDRRALARRHARDLAVERAVPDWVRENVRANWRFYAQSASNLFPSVWFTRIELHLPEGFHPCNPSLAVLNGALWCVLRTVNYRLDGNMYRVEGDGVLRTRNYLLKLDESLLPVSSVPIRERPERPEHPAIDGLEDIRLTAHGEGFRGSATVVDPSPSDLRRMAVFDLELDGQATHLTFQDYGAQQHQKNWVPFVDRGQLGFLYATDPTNVLRWDQLSRQATPWLQRTCPLALENLRGSSGAIAFDDGWLYVAHEVSWAGTERTYLHRFVQLDGDFRLRAVTEPFFFQAVGIEFCCGLVDGPSEGRLLLSFGREDSQAWLASVSVEEVRRELKTMGALQDPAAKL